ncbi:pleckstrin homology domain-containing family D member 1-like isoform X2 [Antedon mediterranea]|uniref:pleckstrin homology domain-containing family D member 1-like isoform X2 n=1 Tax=Antedon mediterranea TaxID=105859 RepID=UPI003AF62ACD
MTDYDFDYNEMASRVQLWGVLWKKPFGQGSTSNKWTKRFFIIKEGFLLYYPENEKREFEKRRYFHMHPKGVIPLGGCKVVSYDDSCKSWAFKIDNEELSGGIYLATETENERERWCEMMSKSARITWKNAELGDCMIQTLEKQSLELAKDSQKYRNQWHSEAVALRDEMDRNEELERMAAELEIEKAKIEQTARELQDEHERTRMELEETIRAMSQVAHDKEELSRASHDYHSDLASLAMEREKTMSELTKREDTMKQLTTENESLTWETQQLKSNLGHIERRTKELEDVMRLTESRLDEKKKEAQLLEEEKLAFSKHAQELQCSLNDLTVQKELTDAELRQEIMARRDAEFRLKMAEESLSRLDSALQQSRDSRPPCLSPNKVSKQNELDSTINQSVSTLKKFFEEIAEEAKIDQDKPIIMKNALHARKSFIRKTKSFKYRKERSMSMLSNRQTPVKKINYRKTMATEHDLQKQPNFEKWKKENFNFTPLQDTLVNGAKEEENDVKLNDNNTLTLDSVQTNNSKTLDDSTV